MNSEELQTRLARETVVHIQLAQATNSVRQAIRRGDVVPVLPGLYAGAEVADEALTRMLALHLRYPDTVFTELSAAGLLWDSVPLPEEVTAIGRLRGTHRGFAMTRRQVDPDWITAIDRMRCTSPELTAIDLIPSRGARFVDLALRKAGGAGAEALQRMWDAHRAHPQRAGNDLRHVILTESRDIPWSEAERQAHIDLRNAGITGWRTNHPISVNGETYYVDIAFPDLKLAIELDGYEFHSSRAAFERDRRRQNSLISHGWAVLRFTWSMLTADPPGNWLEGLAPWLHPALGVGSTSWPRRVA